MFFVEARYHRDPRRAGAQVRYISHREEGLTDGRRRELYGIGERYRALRGDESAIRKALREDGRGLRGPVYFRFIMTVDDPRRSASGASTGTIRSASCATPSRRLSAVPLEVPKVFSRSISTAA